MSFHMLKGISSLFLVIISLFLTVIVTTDRPVTAQDESVHRDVDVSYYVTDVVVRDADGKFVSGLTANDFVFRVDGKPVDIKYADEWAVEKATTRTEKVVTEQEEDTTSSLTPSRFIVIVLDRVNNSSIAFQEIKESAVQMVEEILTPSDRVAVFQFNNSLIPLVTMSTDKAEIIEAIRNCPMANPGDLYVPDEIEVIPPPLGQENVLAGKNRSKLIQFDRYLRSLTALGRAYNSVLGKKFIIMFSDGCNVYNPVTMDTKGDYSYLEVGLPEVNRYYTILDSSLPKQEINRKLEDFTRDMNSLNVTMINVRRGAIDPPWLSEAARNSPATSQGVDVGRQLAENRRARHGALIEMADSTGGTFITAGMSREEFVETVEKQMSGFYLLHFQPPSVKPGEYHQISVEVKNTAYSVTHRSGYQDLKNFVDFTDDEKLSHLNSAVMTAGLTNDLAMTVSTSRIPTLGNTAFVLNVNMETARLGHTGKDNHELEAVVMVQDSEGNTRYFDHNVFKRGRLDAGIPLWINEKLPCLKGKCAVSVVVRDNASGRIASWKGDLPDIPEETDRLQFSRPVLFGFEKDGNILRWDKTSKTSQEAAKPATEEKTESLDLSCGSLLHGEVKQGKSVKVLLMVGNLLKGVDPRTLPMAAYFISNPETPEKRCMLAIEKPQARIDDANRMLLLTAEIPLGLAQKESGELLVIVRGLAPNQDLQATVPFRIVDFSEGKAAELMNDKRVQKF